MLFSNFKLVLREFLKSKTGSILIITGMTLGLASFILIYQFIVNELGFDRFHNKTDRMYRVICDVQFGNSTIHAPASTPPMAKVLIDEYPEIETATRVVEKNLIVGSEKKYFNEPKIAVVDSNFFQFFNFNMKEGNPEKALMLPNSVVITEKMAKKYFRDRNPIGLNLEILDNEVKTIFIVTGVLKDIPRNSSLNYDFYLPITAFPDDNYGNWNSLSVNTFVLLKNSVSQNNIDKAFENIVKKYVGGNRPEFDEWLKSGNKFSFYLQPVSKIHLYSDFEADYQNNSNIKIIYILGIIGLLIITISTVNYINLSGIRIFQYSNKTSLLKVLGARTNSLVINNILLSLAICFTSLFIAFLIVAGMSEYLKNQFENQEFNILQSADHIFYIILFTFVIGILSGFLPAIRIYLNTFKNTPLLNQKSGNLKSKHYFVAFQNILSIGLIISAIVIFKQTKLLENKDLGFNTSNLLIIKNGELMRKNIDVFKTMLLKNPEIEEITVSDYVPSGEIANYNTMTFSDDHDTYAYSVSGFSADDNFLATYGVDVADGRDFAENTVLKNECFLNQAAVKKFNIKNPVGKTVKYNRNEYTIAGIIPDFNYESLKYIVRPVIITKLNNNTGQLFISVRCSKNNTDNTVKFINQSWDKMAGDMAFDYYFLEDNLYSQYKKEHVFSNIVIVFSALGIFIACLGIFGLSSFISYQRTKEIGIRKVNGARVKDILAMLNSHFVLWIVIAFILACPVAWYGMNKWLQNFAYQTEISWWIFIVSGLIAIAITMLTVSLQSLKTANKNPVEALRYE